MCRIPSGLFDQLAYLVLAIRELRRKRIVLSRQKGIHRVSVITTGALWIRHKIIERATEIGSRQPRGEEPDQIPQPRSVRIHLEPNEKIQHHLSRPWLNKVEDQLIDIR